MSEILGGGIPQEEQIVSNTEPVQRESTSEETGEVTPSVGTNENSEQKEISTESVLSVADKYIESLNIPTDDESEDGQVIVSLGTLFSTVPVNRNAMIESITNVKNQLSSGEISKEQALNTLWNGNLTILAPSQRTEFVDRVSGMIQTEIQSLKGVLEDKPKQ